MIAAALLACAAFIHPITLQDVIGNESGGNPLALHVNGISAQPRAASVEQAAQIARSYIAKGYSVDLGLMQVNSRNLPAFGLTIEQALDPCTNIRTGGTILAENYGRATQRLGKGQGALKVALSLYNTGSPTKGFNNGYVARYYGAATIPAIKVSAPAVHPPSPPDAEMDTADTIYFRGKPYVRFN